jgi:hypothetical protein
VNANRVSREPQASAPLRVAANLAIFFVVAVAGAQPPDPAAVERGRKALLERSHLEGRWTREGFDKLESSGDSVREKYGLFPAPYENHGLPMGLRPSDADPKRIVLDCLICHGGSLLGESRVGLPNTTSDLAPLFRDLTKESGLQAPPNLLQVNRARGVTNAGALGVLFFAFRNDDLSPRALPMPLAWHKFPDLDAPAWWLLKKKKTMYCDGGMSADSTRSLMQFLMVPGRPREQIFAAEPAGDDVRQFIRSQTPPPYPFPVDRDLATRGEAIFVERCAECHGTYGPDGKYPNRIVPIDEIGTDRVRVEAISDAARDHYNRTWFGEKHPAKKTSGYQAPPLDGLWATAPYFHNGAVPTVHHVLDSKSRPQSYRRFSPDDPAGYDREKLGFKFVDLPPPSRFDRSDDSRRTFDARRFGASTVGHPFGDDLADQERRTVIEYLKTL